MLNWLDLAVVCSTGVISTFLGSVAGTGGTLVLMPVLVIYFGIQDATVLITVGNLAANLSRAVVNRRELDLKVVAWFALGAIPLSVLGTWLFTISAPEYMARLLGAFILGVVVWRRMKPHPPPKRATIWFLPVGAGFGFLSGLVPGVGVLMAPFYLAYGLTRNAYIGTDAFATVFMQVTKLATLGVAQFVTGAVVVNGLVLVPFMIVGTLIGKRLLDRLPERVFAFIIEAVMVVSGLNFLVLG